MIASASVQNEIIRITPDTSEFAIRFERLNITAKDISPLLEGNATRTGGLGALVEETLLEAQERVCPRAGYRIFDDSRVDIQSDGIILGGTRFRTGRRVPERINEASAMAAYVVSPGVDIEGWETEMSGRKEFLKLSVVHAINMLATERSADWLEHKMRETYRRSGLGLTNRFDVGFCGWNPHDAPMLLDLFPKGFCDVEIRPDKRMRPETTMAGLIGIGFNALRREHPCYRCMYNIACVRRRS